MVQITPRKKAEPYMTRIIVNDGIREIYCGNYTEEWESYSDEMIGAMVREAIKALRAASATPKDRDPS